MQRLMIMCAEGGRQELKVWVLFGADGKNIICRPQRRLRLAWWH